MVFDPIYKAIGKGMSDRYFVDVGANIGDTAVVMRHNATNPILCIEGHKPFLDCLRQNTRSLAKVSIAPTFVAVGEAKNIPLRFTSQRGTGAFTVAPAGEEMATLPSKPLSLLLEEAGALKKGIAVFKTDTDGMDALILQDFLRIDTAPAALFFEFDVLQTIPKQSAETTWQNVFDTLRDRGYSLVVFDNFGYQMATCYSSSFEMVWELNRYVEAQFRHRFVHTYYLDIWAFPPTMSSIFEGCRVGGPLRNLPSPNELVADIRNDTRVD
jgi:FkbM family methyltransferase